MRRALLITCFGLGLALPAGALGVGGPVPPMEGGAGAGAPGVGFNYVTIAGARGTIVERVRRSDGVVERYRRIPGSFGVPGAAYDGSTTGLSADGRTLVLAANSRAYPPPATRLAVLDTVRLRVSAQIDFPGMFAVDAISPDGRWLYLTHYRSASNLNDYEVRAYDLERHELLSEPIVDPREPDEKMQGQPATRLMSRDGRWAYTLYDRSPAAPFIHALDTQGRRAFCVDLPQLAKANDVFGMRLALGPRGTLRVLRQGIPVALMNTRTLAAGSAPAAKPLVTPKPSSPSGGGGGGFPWELVLIPVAATLVALAVALKRRRREVGPLTG